MSRSGGGLSKAAADATYVPKATTQATGQEARLWTVTPSTSGAGRAPFVLSVDETAFTGFYGASKDPLLMVGYNQKAGGTLVQAGEPGWGLGIEGYYDDGTANLKAEAYMQYLAGDNSKYLRPIFIQMDRTNHAVSALQFSGPLIQFFDQIGGVPGGALLTSKNFVDIRANYLIVYAPDTSQDSVLRTKAATGRAAQLSLGYNAVDDVLVFTPAAANTSYIKKNGHLVACLFDNPIGALGAAFSVGEQDNSAAGVFSSVASANGLKSLVSRSKSTQSANNFEIQESGGTAHIYATKALAATPSSFVVGKAVLANAATDGFLYLPTIAGTPSGVPTTRTGTVATFIDTTASKLWAYIGGAWKSVALA